MKQTTFLTVLFCWFNLLQAGGHPGVDRIYETFSLAYATANPELVANLYTDNALYLTPGTPTVRRGKAAILASFSGFFERQKKAGRTSHIEFKIIDRTVSPELVQDVGYYRLEYTVADSDETLVSYGKFVTVSVPGTDGSWRFHVDGYSDSDEQGWQQAKDIRQP